MHRDCVEEWSCDQSHAPHLELFTDVCNVSIIVHHLDEGQVVSLPTVIVIVVVGGGDLDSSCSKRHVHHLISHDG